MNFALIICTYKRAKSLNRLLDSVTKQSLYPNEILVIDGSPDDDTKEMLQRNLYKNLKYHKVKPEQLGLTKQRNVGLNLCDKTIEVVCFLDDDTVLKHQYFENLIFIFENNVDITGIGGVSINENRWVKNNHIQKKSNYLYCDGYKVKLSVRNRIRKVFGLLSNLPSGRMPKFSHGNTQSYPLTGKFYEVDLIIGMSMSFRSSVAFNQNFSNFFEGYGLYEDADYSIRALKYGKNVIATNVQLEHHHHPSGRPNRFNYGKMVVTNGWYVWRLRWPQPGFKNILKWHTTCLLLTLLRFLNTFTTSNKKEAFTESIGRFTAWLLLWVKTPKIEK